MTMKKVKGFSLLKVKAIDNEQRIITGMATTPRVDRVGDTIDPEGVEFNNPSPLLWMHDDSLPVGTVKFGKPTKDGIPFEAQIPVIDNPAGLKARVDEAWESVKSGLVACVSIGFQSLEWSVNELTGGYNFMKSELLELSLVTIPANPDAKITGIKSIDNEFRAALGTHRTVKLTKSTPAGVTAKPSKTVKPSPQEGKSMLKIGEQIKNFQTEKDAKLKEMEAIMGKSGESGETLNTEDQELFDTLQGEVDTISKHLDRLRSMQKSQAEGAQPVVVDADVPGKTDKSVTTDTLRASQPVRQRPQLEKGIGLARVAKAMAFSKMNTISAEKAAEILYPNDDRIRDVVKANVLAGTTTGSTWAAPLVGVQGEIYADFAEFLRPMSIIGKIPNLRKVPFRTRLIGQTSGGAAYWTAEGKPKPLTKLDFAGTTLTPLKVATIAVATMELIRDSSPSADAIIRDTLAAAVTARLDIDFIDPEKTASAGVSPASITNGVTPIVSSGSDADAVRCDITALMKTFLAANNTPLDGVFIMSNNTALALSMMNNPLGQKEFPGMTMTGGTLAGLPVITSQYVPAPSAGGYIFLVNASDVYFADDGDVVVDVSQEASLEMLDNPTNNPTTPTATSMVSLWQNNCVGFRAERTVNWGKRRPSAVAVLSAVNYGDCFS